MLIAARRSQKKIIFFFDVWPQPSAMGPTMLITARLSKRSPRMSVPNRRLWDVSDSVLGQPSSRCGMFAPVWQPSMEDEGLLLLNPQRRSGQCSGGISKCFNQSTVDFCPMFSVSIVMQTGPIFVWHLIKFV